MPTSLSKHEEQKRKLLEEIDKRYNKIVETLKNNCDNGYKFGELFPIEEYHDDINDIMLEGILKKVWKDPNIEKKDGLYRWISPGSE